MTTAAAAVVVVVVVVVLYVIVAAVVAVVVALCLLLALQAPKMHSPACTYIYVHMQSHSSISDSDHSSQS